MSGFSPEFGGIPRIHHITKLMSHSSCDFYDSVNITSGFKTLSGHILYNGVTYSKAEYSSFKYVLVNNTEKQDVEAYPRGCLCQKTKCIRVCENSTNDGIFVKIKNETVNLKKDKNYGILPYNPACWRRNRQLVKIGENVSWKFHKVFIFNF